MNGKVTMAYFKLIVALLSFYYNRSLISDENTFIKTVNMVLP